MRWNGVFILGLGLTALGFCSVVWTSVFGPPVAAAATISVALLAMGALVACLGTLLNRPETFKRAARRGARLFAGRPSRNGANGRNFGQRQAYGALPPVSSKPTGPKIEFKKPGEVKQPAQKAETLLAIEGPR
jgi:hypothetical protein